ncbi:hypothetical protein I315_04597 [Cryptococcus gattii Ru294]|uniref:Protein-tyrosine-phosphatase n=1 Tax=Cryptococcus gattii EJB2 TaxID=1296103 RepID=A0ABR5BT39_9TREE|nr:hypothetical protein I315_04597 [Cryptococcus gattii Ru294]KIR78840.1 hypothetical protein I306_04050 [Cryptococcus gattii EJB2]KIY32972.1 hypothetical protein I305_04725 [Cryptococcus gattii E566]
MAFISNIERAYRVLADREVTRLEYSQLQKPSIEQAFYSVHNSLDHRRDNRYSNVLAYDRTAVTVDGEYLNANVVTDGKGGRWIAAQAPPPQAFNTFFKALYSGAATGRLPNNAILVQLTGWEESGIPKADPYMEHKMPDMGVHLSRREIIDRIASTLTEVALQGDRRVNLFHYQFDAWPDHGVPTGKAVQALRELVKEVDEKRRALDCEVWVHCSAGVGRTGTFIALSSLLSPDEPHVSSPIGPLPLEIAGDRIAKTVDTIRESRGMLVQTPSQFELLYRMQ